MKNALKKATSVFLVAVMLFGASPLAGFVGLDLPELNFFSIKAEAEEAPVSGTCGENVTWTFDESTGILTISGEGDMYNFESSSETPWYEYAESIKSVEISDGVTLIGGFAFSSCTALTSVTIPESIFFIGPYAFESCSGLTSINIPGGVTEIGASAFYFCTGLINVTLPDSLKHIGAYAFKGCDSLTNITIPDSVISIGGEAFFSCDSLTSITIPDRVTYIEDLTLAYCVNLTDITIGKGVTKIGKAFCGCENLTTITIPYSVEIIADHAFGGCTKLTDVYFTGKESEWKEITIESYNDNLLNATIHFNENPRILTGTYNDNTTWTFDEATGVLTISGDGEMEYRDFKFASDVTEIIISDGVTGIGADAFRPFGNLTSVTIPDSVNYIGDYAFSWCYSLEEISLPDKLEYLGANAFEYCDMLSEVTIPDGVNELVGTFVGCYSLTKVTIPASVTLIDGAFDLYGVLADIYFQGSHTQWNNIEISDDLSNVNIYYAFSQITWNTGEKTIVDFYEPGSAVTVPESPVKEGCTFVGWDAQIPETAPEYDLVITAEFTPNPYTVTWIVNGEETVVDYNYGDKIVIPETPTKEHYTFMGWGEEIPETVPDEDLVFTAQWELNKHTVTWTVDGEETVDEYSYGDEIIIPESPEKEGYTFAGWGAEIPGTVPDEDLIFTAQWELNKHTVTWIVDGDESVVEYNYGEEIVVPETPEKEGYAFAGWTPEIPSTMSDNSLEFTAVFTPNPHTVTWIVDGVETVDEYSYGDEIVIPETPVKTGYDFIGWGADIPGTVPDEDLIFTAQWEISKYTVTWNVDGEKTVDEYVYGDEIAVPESPVKEGYSFNGWTPAIPDTMPEQDLEFTATWLADVLTGTCGDNAAWALTRKTGELVITGTGEIYDEAFRNNNTIKSVKISEGITKIGALAFAECNSLTSVVFPESLVEFGDVSFGLCFNLSEIVLPGNIKRMGGNPFQETAYAYDNRGEDGSLYIGTCLLEAANTSDFIVKEGTTVIAAGAFQDRQYSRLVIPAGVEYIPERLFENASISELVIPYTVNTISDFLFGSYWRANIDTIYFSGSYAEWERIYFEGDPNSAQYNAVRHFFESGVEMIFDSQGYGQEGNYTYSINRFNEAVITKFSGTCNGELIIPETLGGYPVTGIGDNVFKNKTSITTVNIPERITYIGNLAFYGCINLVDFTLPDVPIHIGAQAIENTGYYNDANNWHKDILYVGNHLITRKGTDLGFEIQEGAIKEGTITIAAEALGGTYNMGDTLILPDSLVYIEEAAFMSSFISNVEIPDSVTYLGPYAFAMSGISSVKLSSRLTEIYECTFSKCPGLKTLTVPLKVGYIDTGAFYGCENLSSIVLPKSLQIISDAAFVDPCFPDDIYYEGTEADWEKVTGKEQLEASMIHFNYEYKNVYSVKWVVDGQKTVVNYNVGEEIIIPETPVKEGYTFAGWSAEIPSAMPDYDLIFTAQWEINKHTVTWIVDGKETIEEYSYGDEIVAPENPTKEGYTFAGWGEKIPSTVPDEDLVFTAQWEINKHTVTWIVDGEEIFDEYSYGDEIAVPETPTIEGYTFVCWDKSIPLTMPDDDLVFTAQWIIKKHTVTWIVEGEETVDEYSYGDEIAVPETPTKEGYTFTGWGAEVPPTVPDEDLVFTAQWKINTYTVTWIVNGEKTAVEYNFGDKIEVYVPQTEGLTFIKWTPDVPGTMPAENLEFTAVFEGKSYTVEWNIDGLVMSETYKFGDAIDKTKTFNKKGYTFVGWSPEIPDAMPAQNLEFTAVFEANLYDAVFYTNGGIFPDGDSIKRVPTAYNSAISVPLNPEKAGYDFAGWAYNGKNVGTNLGIMDSVEGKTFEAIWASNNTALYKVETYTMNTLGEYEVSSMILNATAFEEISVNPVAGEGFEVDAEKSVLNGIVSNEEILVLKVYLERKQYLFTTIADSVKSSALYYYGSVIAEPATPVKAGYTFEGWDSEIPATMPANDITVTAKFNIAPQDSEAPRIVMITPENRTVYYGESITLQVVTYNLPEGAKVKWEVNGDGVSIRVSASGKSCKVTSTSNGNVIIRAYIVDSKGNTIAGKDGNPISDYEYLYSEVNLWLIIINFIKQLFGKTDTVSQMLKSI